MAKSTSKTTPKSDTEAQPSATITKVGFDQIKDAIPSAEGVVNDVQTFAKDQLNVDLQKVAGDATDYVRRNPGTALAAAAGVGLLVGLLASKRA